MASFKDIVPQFTPYVQQLPVEEMVQVGMYKQQLYDQGVQKIQSQIDNIAGLDIVHDSDRAYLQSKLDELTTNLRGVAAGDFSDQNLVNSISGMTSQLIKDKNIQSAVASTAWFRKENELMEKAIAEGKASPQNIKDFKIKTNEWLSSTKVGENFRGRYTPYKDVTTELTEFATKVMSQAKESKSDNPYISDEQGRTLYYDRKGNASLDSTKGKPIVADVMKKISVSGVSSEKLYNLFKDILDPSDMEQLRIDAQYEWGEKSPEFFKSSVENTYTEQKKQMEEAIVKYTVELGNNNLSQESKNKLEKELTLLQNKLNNGDLEKDRDKLLKALDTKEGLSRYMTNVYTNEKLRNLAKDINNEAISIESVVNPYFTVTMEKNKFNLETQKAANDQIYKDAMLQLAVNRDIREQEKHEQEKHDKEHKNDAIVSNVGIDPNVEVLTATEVSHEVNGLTNELNKIKLEIGKKMSTDPKAKPEQLIKIGTEFLNRYDENPSIVNGKGSAIIELVEKAHSTNKNLIVRGELLNKIKKETSQINSEISKQLNKHNPLSIGSSRYTPEDILTFVDKLKKLNVYTNNPKAPGTANTGLDAVPMLLDDQVAKFKGTKFYNLARSLSINNATILPSKQKQSLAFVANYMGGIVKEVNSKNVTSLINKKFEIEKKVIADNSPETIRKRYSFSNNNVDDFSAIDKAITAKIGEYNDIEQNIGKGKGTLDVDKLSDADKELMTASVGNKNRIVNLYRNSDNTGYLAVSVKGQEGIARIPLTSQQMTSWFPKYSTVNPMTEIKNMASYGNKTTNLRGIRNPVTAGITGFSNLTPMLKNTEFSSRVRIDIEGSENNDGGTNDRFDIVVYYNDPKSGWKKDVLNKNGYLYEDKVMDALKMIAPNTIKELFK